MGQAKSVSHRKIIGKQFITQVYKVKIEDVENAENVEDIEETLEDKVNENYIKTDDVEELLEPVEVDKNRLKKYQKKGQMIWSRQNVCSGWILSRKYIEETKSFFTKHCTQYIQ